MTLDVHTAFAVLCLLAGIAFGRLWRGDRSRSQPRFVLAGDGIALGLWRGDRSGGVRAPQIAETSDILRVVAPMNATGGGYGYCWPNESYAADRDLRVKAYRDEPCRSVYHALISDRAAGQCHFCFDAEAEVNTGRVLVDVSA